MPHVYAPELFARKRHPQDYTTKYDKFIEENKDVCPYILADTLHVKPRFIITRKQKLGLMPMAGKQPPKRTQKPKRDKPTETKPPAT